MITTLRNRSQITLPAEVIRKLRLNTGDNLEITVDDDKIILKPVVIVDRSQAWFWSDEWQNKEKEVEKDIKEGRVHSAKDVDDLFKGMDS